MDIDKAIQSMIDNLHKNTGKTLAEWITIVQKENFQKHGEILKYLKEKHGFTHGFANFVALKSKGSDAASTENSDDLINTQYKGKENLKAIYDLLIKEIENFGTFEIAPKNSNVSLRRKKQFCTLGPATKTRFEIGINLKGQEPTGKLEASKNAMCTHRIDLSSTEEIDAEVLDWIKKAFDNAG